MGAGHAREPRPDLDARARRARSASSSSPRARCRPSRRASTRSATATTARARPRRASSPGRHEIGIEHILWGSDYPHYEGTFPNSRKAMRHTLPRQARGRDARDPRRERRAALRLRPRRSSSRWADQHGPKPDGGRACRSRPRSSRRTPTPARSCPSARCVRGDSRALRAGSASDGPAARAAPGSTSAAAAGPHR